MPALTGEVPHIEDRVPSVAVPDGPVADVDACRGPLRRLLGALELHELPDEGGFAAPGIPHDDEFHAVVWHGLLQALLQEPGVGRMNRQGLGVTVYRKRMVSGEFTCIEKAWAVKSSLISPHYFFFYMTF